MCTTVRPVIVLALFLTGVTTTSSADETSHRAAAEEILTLTNTEKVMQAAMDTMLDAQLKANPTLEPVKDVMKRFLAKYLSFAAVKEDMITLYVTEFTEEELKELAAFYRTPTGKKAIEKLPVLFQKGAEIGTKRVQEHLPELQQMIQAELRKKAGGSPKL
jgi:hypothetical protein